MIRKLVKYFIKKVFLIALFNLTVFKILLFKDKLGLAPAQRSTESERVKFSVKNKKNAWILLKLLEK